MRINFTKVIGIYKTIFTTINFFLSLHSLPMALHNYRENILSKLLKLYRYNGFRNKYI